MISYYPLSWDTIFPKKSLDSILSPYSSHPITITNEEKNIIRDKLRQLDTCQDFIKKNSWNSYQINNNVHTPLNPVFNYPTRGPPEDFKHVGHLWRNTDKLLFQLYGRRRHSSVYDYYIHGKSKDGVDIKIPLKINHNKELYDGDTVEIDMYKDSGRFTIHMLPIEHFVYNPNLF